ncbi:MAG TPA: M48 family metalloprotease, partial [Gemmatimonadales bacterium]|nr:M48 family metalloprotease [Gemmatimonadales bacterium]
REKVERRASEMDLTKFRGLVERLEREAAVDPERYRDNVIALAILGYGVVVGVLALLIGAIVLMAYLMYSGYADVLFLKLIFAAGLLALVIVRALWVRIPPPEGLEITASDAPKLFVMIEQIREQLAGPRVHHVLVTEDLNAAVSQVPRFGILGGQRNYLVLGLPLMHSLAPEQFRAVLAHEFGHLSRNHGRWQGWIYRVRLTWARLLDALRRKKKSLSAVVFSKFVEWYAPFFNAYSFVLARGDEYVADRCAAEVAGPDSIAQALQRIEILARFTQERFWPEIGRSTEEMADPHPGPMAAFVPMLQGSLTHEDAAKWLTEAWNRPTDYDDTHPSLSDRLRPLGYQPAEVSASLPRQEEASAAQHYLGEASAVLTARVDDQWRASIADAWRGEHEAAKARRARLAVLEARQARGEAMDSATRWELIALTSKLRDKKTALDLAEALLASDPAHAPTRCFIGQALLERGDETGIGYLEAAMAADASLILPATAILFGYLWSKGRREEAERYRAQAMERQKLLEQAEAERAEVPQRLELEPHDLPAETVAGLRRALYRIEGLAEVYLARRGVELLPEQRSYIAGVLLARNPSRLHSGEKDAISKRLLFQVPWPEGTGIGLLNNSKHLLRKFREIPGALLLSPTLPPPEDSQQAEPGLP